MESLSTRAPADEIFQVGDIGGRSFRFELNVSVREVPNVPGKAQGVSLPLREVSEPDALNTRPSMRM